MTGVSEPADRVQLRLGFTGPDATCVLGIHLQGLTIVVDCWEGRFDDAWRYLLDAGITATLEEERGIVFPLRDLPLLVRLPERVELHPMGPAEVLVRLAIRRPGEPPATVSTTATGTLCLAYWEGEHRVEMPLPPEAATAMLAADLPFVATAEAWAVLDGPNQIPLLAGKATFNFDGYIEITTHTPQVVERSDLPGLFRLGDTRFGMSTSYSGWIDKTPGFDWTGRKPPDMSVPRVVPVPVPVGETVRRDTESTVEALARMRAAVVALPSGRGRRIVALTALESIDGWPALIVCPPWGVLVWQQLLTAFGRSVSLFDDRADARIVTYLDLARGARTSVYGTIVFDDLAGDDARDPRALTALRGLDALSDAYRLGVTSTWPEDPVDACRLLDVVRPGEFSLDTIPFEHRYPVDPERRFSEHAHPYVVRSEASTAATPPVASTNVRLVHVDDEFHKAYAKLCQQTGPLDRERLDAACELVRAGQSGRTGPKIAAAVDVMRSTIGDGRRGVVVTRSSKVALMVAVSLSPATVTTVHDGGDVEAAYRAGAEVVVVHWSEDLPNVGSADDICVVDMPWSSATLARAVSGGKRTQRLFVLHAPGTLDDRVAMWSARNWERGVGERLGTPGDEAAAWFLMRRWPVVDGAADRPFS